MSSKKAIVTLRKPHLPRDSLYENMGDDYIQITTILFWILAFTFKITHDKMICIKQLKQQSRTHSGCSCNESIYNANAVTCELFCPSKLSNYSILLMLFFLRANRKKIIFQFWHKIPGKYILYFILLGIDRSF